MSTESGRTVFCILTSDPTEVQGNTEKHYVVQHLSERTSLHLFAPLSEEVEGAHNYDLPLSGLQGALILNVLLVPYWMALFLKVRPEIVYCYQNAILPALLGKWFFGATVAFDLQSDPFKQAEEFSEFEGRNLVFRTAVQANKYLHKVALHQADHIYVVSDSLKASVLSKYPVSEQQISVLPLGVDTARFSPCGETFEKLSILYVGSLTPYRGIDTFFEAVNELSRDQRENVRLDLYGDGPEDYLEGLIENVSDTIDVYWHGTVSHEELPEKACKSDIAVSPIPPYEAYEVSSPAKIFEYLALGLPVVASSITPHQRILTEETGVLYDPDDVDSFSNAIKQLLVEDDLREQMADSAREQACKYSWDNRFEILHDTLQIN